jgi:hypothetical protein
MKRCKLSIIAIVLVLSFDAMALEWYENVTFVDNDPFQFDSQRSVLFPHSGLTLAGLPASGKLYAVLPAATVTQLQNDPKHLIVIDSHVLTGQEATSYQNIFHDAASAGQVPWIVGAIGSIPSTVTSAIGITSTLLDGLTRYAQTGNRANASALEQLMAKNGRFDLVLVLIPDPKVPSHQFVSSTVVYNTTVGAETRTYAICSSTFALKVQ